MLSAERLLKAEALLKLHQVALFGVPCSFSDINIYGIYKADLNGIQATLPTKADAKDLNVFAKRTDVEKLDYILKLKGDKDVLIQTKIEMVEKFQVLFFYFPPFYFCYV